jgi:hypothetical protein
VGKIDEDGSLMKEEPKDQETIPEEIEFEEQNNALSEFILELVKALLQTGYYTADHPHAKQALEGLYETFVKTMHHCPEISFVRSYVGDVEDIVVDGYRNDQDVSLLQALPKEVAHLFLPKFLEFFHRKRLLSFAIKTMVAEGDFVQFLSLLSESVDLDRDSKGAVKALDGEAISRQLQRCEIYSISVVIEKDLLYQRGKLPWRVELALARLKKDFSILPLFEKKSEEELQKIQFQLIRDIMRPVRDEIFARDILLHADLVTQVAETKGVLDLEGRILQALHKELRIPTIKNLLHLMKQKGDAVLVSGENVRDRSEQVIKRMIPALNAYGGEEAADVFRYLYSAKVLPFEDLPEAVRKALYLEDTTNRFLQDPSILYQEMVGASDEEEYKKLLRQVVAMLPRLAERKHLEVCSDLIALLNDHRSVASKGLPQRGELCERSIDYLLSKTKWLALCFSHATSNKPKDQEALIKLGGLIGPRAIPHLVNAMAETSEASFRQKLSDLIVKRGREALPFLSAKIRDKDLTEGAARQLISIFSLIEGEEVLPPLKELMNRPESSVREEAMAALVSLMGEEGQDFLLGFLDHESPDLVKKAVQLFRAQESLKSKSIQALVNFLKETKDVELQVAILSALSKGGDISLAGGKKLEEEVIEWLSEGSSAWKQFLMRDLSPKVLIASIQLLGRIGTKKAVPALKKLGKAKDEEVRRQAASALKYLKSRIR